jgi:hypothetical protein
MSNWKGIAQLTQQDDQDIESAIAWIEGTDPEAFIHLLVSLGKTYENPITEVMTRFAMLGLSTAVRVMLEREEGTNDER